jgi:hypothetical protein
MFAVKNELSVLCLKLQEAGKLDVLLQVYNLLPKLIDLGVGLVQLLNLWRLRAFEVTNLLSESHILYLHILFIAHALEAGVGFQRLERVKLCLIFALGGVYGSAFCPSHGGQSVLTFLPIVKNS